MNLEVDSKRGVAIRTLAKQTASSEDFTELTIQFLMNNEKFEIKNALITNRNLLMKRALFPTLLTLRGLQHFKGVKIPVISKRRSINVLIGTKKY